MYFTRVIKEKKNVDCQSIRSWHGICHILPRFTISAQKKGQQLVAAGMVKLKKFAILLQYYRKFAIVLQHYCKSKNYYFTLHCLVYNLRQYCSIIANTKIIILLSTISFTRSVAVLQHFCMVSYESYPLSSVSFSLSLQNILLCRYIILMCSMVK